MKTLNLTPEQRATVWDALEDRVDYLKAEYKSADDFKGGVAIMEELKAAREVLEILETLAKGDQS